MQRAIDRRGAIKTLGLACLAAPLVHAAPKRRLKIGHTSITWGSNAAAAEPGIKDAAKLGYRGYESLGETLEAWEAKADSAGFSPRTTCRFPPLTCT